MRKILRRATSLVVFVSFSACGDTDIERALMGAGAGTVTAVVLDGNLAGGALVGAAVNVAYCKKYPTRC